MEGNKCKTALFYEYKLINRCNKTKASNPSIAERIRIIKKIKFLSIKDPHFARFVKITLIK